MLKLLIGFNSTKEDHKKKERKHFECADILLSWFLCCFVASRMMVGAVVVVVKVKKEMEMRSK